MCWSGAVCYVLENWLRVWGRHAICYLFLKDYDRLRCFFLFFLEHGFSGKHYCH